MGVIVCGGAAALQRMTGPCPERDEARLIVAHSDSPYYSPMIYCECGDVMAEGGRMARPFARGWRKRAQEQFGKMWEEATDGPPERCPTCLYLTCSCDRGEPA